MARAKNRRVGASALRPVQIGGGPMAPALGQKLKCFTALGESFLKDRRNLGPLIIWRGVSAGYTGQGSPGLNEDDAWVPPGFCCPWPSPPPGCKMEEPWPARLSDMTHQQLYNSVKAHVCGLSWPPSPYISVTPNMQTACDFATGHFAKHQWHENDQAIHPGKIAVLNPASIPDLHERMVWVPHVNQEFGRLKCEFLIYRPVDVKEADLRWVTVAQIRTALHCGQWPRCSLQQTTMHSVREEEMQAAWMLGGLFTRDSDDDWVKIVVAIYELARQQVKGGTFINDASDLKLYGTVDFSPECAEAIRRFILHRCPNLTLGGVLMKKDGSKVGLSGLNEPGINRATRGFPVLYMVNHFLRWFVNGSLILTMDEIKNHDTYMASNTDENQLPHQCNGPKPSQARGLGMEKGQVQRDLWNFSYCTYREKSTRYVPLRESYASLADTHWQVLDTKDLIQESYVTMDGRIWIRVGGVWYWQVGDLWYSLPGGANPKVISY